MSGDKLEELKEYINVSVGRGRSDVLSARSVAQSTGDELVAALVRAGESKSNEGKEEKAKKGGRLHPSFC